MHMVFESETMGMNWWKKACCSSSSSIFSGRDAITCAKDMSQYVLGAQHLVCRAETFSSSLLFVDLK